VYNHLLYFSYWLTNFLVLYIFGRAFPLDVVLGNWRFGGVEAAAYGSFWVTFFVWVLWDFAMAKGVNLDSPIVNLGYFWSANFFAFWIVARFSQYAGVGITNYGWAMLLALGTYLAQRLAWKLIVKKKAK
jgi:hypothetical protein